ncbi:hypothetical protein GGS21DRAFT_531038 [Xylaria nigripes]|nr:hypothetical protein GGS21DRAFT_531038 [Xylaria nigripes]
MKYITYRTFTLCMLVMTTLVGPTPYFHASTRSVRLPIRYVCAFIEMRTSPSLRTDLGPRVTNWLIGSRPVCTYFTVPKWLDT